jgi:hypothetical protein
MMMILMLFTFYVPTLPVEAIGDSVNLDASVESINDNPIVTFTATGIATEPEPINSVGISAADMMGSTWIGPTPNAGEQYKTWAINPYNGALSKLPSSTNLSNGNPTANGGIRFNFDYRSPFGSLPKIYDLLSPNSQVGTYSTGMDLPANPEWGGGSAMNLADIWGNRYAVYNAKLIKFDGNTGKVLWVTPLPTPEPDTFYSLGGSVYAPGWTGGFNPDSTSIGVELYFGRSGTSDNIGTYIFDTATGQIRYVYHRHTDADGFVYDYPWTSYPWVPDIVYSGQLYDYMLNALTDITLKFEIKPFSGTISEPYGFAFRVQDYMDMYRLEITNTNMEVVKYVNGVRTVLRPSTTIPAPNTWGKYQIKLAGTHIKIYQNGSLIFDFDDSEYTHGSFGPYAMGRNTEFKSISYQWSNPDSSYETPGVAIVDTPVTYATTYDDPENDTRLDAGTQWKYEQLTTQRARDIPLPDKLISATQFLDIFDGKSGYVAPSTTGGPILSFDKVGLYKVDYQVPDIPMPTNPAFTGYNKKSNEYTQYLIVHRRPIALFTVTPQANHALIYSDASYDPDRCYASGSCQAGIVNSGIKGEKYYSIDPDGNRTIGKLTHPTKSGSYTLGKAVQDEYKAWSDFYEVTYEVCDACIPPSNNPPAVQLTFPTGTEGSPTSVSLVPTITWNQSDPDVGTVFSVFDLEIRDVFGNCYECVTNRTMNTTNGNWSWTMDRALQMGQKYQVRVKISDGSLWSPWSEIGWMATNSPPVAAMTFPTGTQAAPTIVSTLRPTLTWNQTDPDAGAVYDYFQLQITNEANNVMILDSGKLWQGTSSNSGSWLVTNDLPAAQKLRVRVMVWDQYGSASEWSAQTWLYINRPPTAVMTYPSGSEAAPTVVTTFKPVLTWNQTDPDPGAAFYYFQIQITNEANNVMILDSGKYWQGTIATTGSWTVPSDLPAGQKMRVRVKVWDEFGAESEWSPQTWMYINRPPHADFDWTPKPAFEGDAVTLINKSTDPDGDTLTFIWQIAGPAYSSVQSSIDAVIPAAVTDYHPGDYMVTLTATDPYGASDTVTKPVRVGDLQVEGFVRHTAQWDLNRKSYNRLKSGEDERPRPVGMFWSGEAFVLEAQTNEPAAQVQAVMSYTELRSVLASVHFTAWTAQLYRNDFESLPDQDYMFQFTAVWPNGHVETAARTITVSNPWTDFTSSVRKE